MVYKYETEKIKLPRALDRRIALTQEQREDILQKFKDGIPMRAIARLYTGICSRSTVIYICRPDRLAFVKQARKDRAKDGRYKPDKRKWAQTMREHRAYKYKVLKPFIELRKAQLTPLPKKGSHSRK